MYKLRDLKLFRDVQTLRMGIEIQVFEIQTLFG